MMRRRESPLRLPTPVNRAAAASLVVLASTAAVAHAQVSCGDVVRPTQSVTLTAELRDCPPGEPAITVIGPATLDLNGFSVGCRDKGDLDSPGIVVVGKRGTVRNGTVQGCNSGVRILGEGSHRIERVVAAINGERNRGGGEGFVVECDGNRLTANTALQNHSSGFRIVVAERNRLTDNRAFFNGGSGGFEISIGRRNRLEGNVAKGNAIFGFYVDAGALSPGGGRNVLRNNTATDNSTGFFVSSEEASTFVGNVADANDFDGMAFFLGRDNRLTRNQANDNGESGIIVASEERARVTANTALNNDRGRGDRNFDLFDLSRDCGTNRWRGNVFVFANEPCIR